MDSRAWHGQPWRLVSAALPHVDLIHLAFNLYWLWAFGTIVEGTLGRWATGGTLLLFAIGSSAAEYALFEGGVGLSGVGYGLFGMLWLLARSDARFAGAVDGRTAALFLGWFVLCCALTAAGAWKVGNAAHAVGAVLGILLALAIRAREQTRRVFVGLLSGTMALILLAAAVGRPYINLAGHVAVELAYLGYLDLEQGRNESAVERYRRALERDASQSDWWVNLGIAQQRLGQSESASHAFQRAIDLRAGDKELSRMLADLKAYVAYQRHVAGDLRFLIRGRVDRCEASCAGPGCRPWYSSVWLVFAEP